jgi:hypothetical protein
MGREPELSSAMIHFRVIVVPEALKPVPERLLVDLEQIPL